MTEDERQVRNKERLTELYPAMRRKVAAIISDMEGHGYRPRIQEAYRSPADQAEAVRTGHSKLMFGFHNVTSKTGTPESLAVDLLDDDHPEHLSTKYLLTLAVSARSHGCETGIKWDVSPAGRAAIETAIATHNLSAHIPVGWDPSHVEPAGHTAEEARAGWRPT